MPRKNESLWSRTMRQIEDRQKKAAKRAVKDGRRKLRSLKVGIIPEIWNDVLAASSRSDGDDLAAAYLIALAKRFALHHLGNPFYDDATRKSEATRLVNHQKRMDAKPPTALPVTSPLYRPPLPGAAPAQLTAAPPAALPEFLQPAESAP